jgi:hypothetical protein
MMEIVINKCYGGFGLSIEAQNLYAKKKGFELFYYEQVAYDFDGGKDVYRKVSESGKVFCIHATTVDRGDEFEGNINDGYWSDHDVERNDPALIEVVKELGEKANGEHAKLKVVEIPDGVEWEIDEYDGIEWIAEKHRTWG